jgi:hypothetical protein
MQNAWDKTNVWSAESKTEVPSFNEGFTLDPPGASILKIGGNSSNGTSSQIDYPEPTFTSEIEELPEKTASKPCFARLCLRIWQIIASVGTFTFQAGAAPVSLPWSYQCSSQKMLNWNNYRLPR